MNDVNEWGVAAHWSYKQKLDLTTTQVEGKQFRWVRELLKILENSETEEFIEHTKLEMYEDQVFCFTPKGEIVALPKGATPVDFAYALHSDIGNTCVGTKINGRIAPLRTKIENGDQVEIVTSKNQVPSVSWEKFIVTAKAKSEVKRFIRLQQKKEYISLGRSILAKFFAQENIDFKEEELRGYLDLFQKKNLDDLFSAVGEGAISRDEVMKVLQGQNKSKLRHLQNTLSFFKFKKKKQDTESSVSIKGMIPGMAVNFATCCYPIPGDQIIGIFYSDKGVTIHTSDCDTLEKISNYGFIAITQENELNRAPSILKTTYGKMFIELKKIINNSNESWDKEASTDGKHVGHLKMIVTHEPNSLATICTLIAKQGCNISNIRITSRSQDFFEFLVDIEVMGITQLTNIMASLRSKECVHSVERSKA